MTAANIEALVTIDWAKEHLQDDTVRFIEIDVDTTHYEKGHIPGAIAWDWTTELQDPVQREIVPREALEILLGAAGVNDDTTLVLYGDNNNWFAAYGYWLLVYHGFDETRLRLLDGGRKGWEKHGGVFVQEVPTYTTTEVRLGEPRPEYRALRDEVLGVANGLDATPLVDVRSPDEYTGKVLAPPGLKETALRGGHVPGAVNVPWVSAVNEEDGTFKSPTELARLYQDAGVVSGAEAIAYCRIGERSSHTWFALNRILGWPAKNYDGSWTEYGNLIAAPIER